MAGRVWSRATAPVRSRSRATPAAFPGLLTLWLKLPHESGDAAHQVARWASFLPIAPPCRSFNADTVVRDFRIPFRFLRDITAMVFAHNCVFSDGQGADLCMNHNRAAPHNNL